MRKTSIIILLLLGISFLCCSKAPFGNDDIENTDFKILFIGNSLTYANDLPGLVRKEAKEKGVSVQTEMIASGNYAIIDHWESSNVQEEISTKKYHFVIIQQGPSSQPEGRRMLIEDGKKYSDLCKGNGSLLCYYMVWPSMTYYSTFDDVIKNHRDAASQNDAILIPVGEVWKKYFDDTQNFDYYSSDGFHPSLKGSKVAAEVIIETLFGK